MATAQSSRARGTNLLVEHDLVHLGAARFDVGGSEPRLDTGFDGIAQLNPRLPAPQDLHLVRGRGIVEPDFEKEAVLLRLWQRIGALVLDWVLRREDEERRWKRKL